MAWISVRYKITKRVDQQSMRIYTLVNLDHVRRVMRTSTGMARLLWGGRGDPITLDESYDSFVERVRTITGAASPSTDPEEGEE